MRKTNQNIQKLFAKDLITNEQKNKIDSYFSLGIFSVRNELLFLMYLSVLLFTSGIGILIYENIDTIGHSILLLILLVLIVISYYFSFKKYPGFSKEDVDFENPIYNYLVLLATILSCSFLGYLQYQYQIFGNQFEIAILISAAIALITAYYFNNKSALSIGITALATSLGITLTPQTLIENEIYWNNQLLYYGLILSVLLLLWAIYSQKIALKKHFDLVLLTFTLHLASMCCIAILINDYWMIIALPLAASTYYFYTKSFKIPSISIFVFTLLYAFIGFNIIAVRLLDAIDIPDYFASLFFFLPIYFIAAIVLFINAIKKFNKITHDSI